jgi:deoxyribose-phosphate aldolase
MTHNIAELIDHTLLKPEAAAADIHKLCDEALKHRFFSVCINPYWIPTAKKHLAGSGVNICTVVAFPLGANLPQSKVAETRAAIDAGADEIDFVINIGAARDARWDFIEHETHDIVSAAQKKAVKAILEIGYLSPEQITEATRSVLKAGAAFVKTATGFGPSGATVEAVKLMRQAAGCCAGVKASGGIRDRVTAEAMIEAGATRLGTSNSVAIVTTQ